MKFGGTSVGSAERIKGAAQIVASYAGTERVVVVVSAVSGVTDKLLAAARKAAAREHFEALELVLEIRSAHASIIEDLGLCDSEAALLRGDVQLIVGELQNFVQSISILGEVTPRTLDYVAGMGERLSSRLVSAALRNIECASEAVEATRFLVTDATFGNAYPLMGPTRARAAEVLGPLIAKPIVPVVTGFIGATEEGYTTTLGRGGSDYSASIIGSALGASELIIWTDVDGVMTANPRIVPEARTLPQISYGEAAELSYFGAKVLHPKTIAPAVEQRIPVYIRDSFHPERAGTCVMPDTLDDGHDVRAITSISRLALVTVQGKGMIGLPGVAARVFSTVAQESINVLMISQSSSEYNICLVIEEQFSEQARRSLERAFAGELGHGLIEGVLVQSGVSIVAVIGASMRGKPGVAGRVFSLMGEQKIDVLAIAQGSSELNLSFVLPTADEVRAVQCIHSAFALGVV
ncbi:MAG TPA: aspartate kinase [Chloroflexia bacterium]|nr:aspartate kinase [Chloroflexia bacterium]